MNTTSASRDTIELLLENTRQTAAGLRVATEMLSRLEERMASMTKSLDGALVELREGPSGSLTTRIALLEQRETSLENVVEEETALRLEMQKEQRTRLWQLWLCFIAAVLSALLSAGIALLHLK